MGRLADLIPPGPRRVTIQLVPDGDGDVVKTIEVDDDLVMMFTWAGSGWTTAADERQQLGAFDLYWEERCSELDRWGAWLWQ